MSVGRHSRGYDSYSDEEDFDGYEKPLSRRDRDRMYRSENDLGKRVREISTQTLRETATQTGQNESVVVQSKMVVKKKRRPRSVSTSGTQTVKKESKAKSRSTDRLNEKDPEKSGKAKTKRSKSSNALDSMESESEKPEKPKPKPKPRRSTSADTHLQDQPDNSAVEKENIQDTNKNPYYPQSEGFVPQQYPQGYIMPPVLPGYQGQPGIPMQHYPNYPINSVPQGYPGYPGAQPGVQPVPGANMSALPKQTAPKQRNKSNWEMLCEMTDGQRVRDDVTETGSVASSVFTNNPSGVPNYGNPPGNPYYGNQQFYNYPPPPPGAGYPAPPQQSHVTHKSVPDYENTEFGGLRVETNGPGKQSSWDMLKTLTQQDSTRTQPTAVVKNRNESVV